MKIKKLVLNRSYKLEMLLLATINRINKRLYLYNEELCIWYPRAEPTCQSYVGIFSIYCSIRTRRPNYSTRRIRSAIDRLKKRGVIEEAGGLLGRGYRVINGDY